MAAVTGSRRTEYAAATRQAIIDAARDLFAERGFVATKVNDIAEVAHVAPKTVYAVVGGKQGLLNLLVDQWVGDPVVTDGLSALASFPDAHAIIRALGQSHTTIHRLHGPVIRVLFEAALIDVEASAKAQQAMHLIRNDLTSIVTEIRRRGELRNGVSTSRAVDILFFYFGTTSVPTLVGDFGWPSTEAQQWLVDQACSAVLRP